MFSNQIWYGKPESPGEQNYFLFWGKFASLIRLAYFEVLFLGLEYANRYVSGDFFLPNSPGEWN